jgi:hypothetical protein
MTPLDHAITATTGVPASGADVLANLMDAARRVSYLRNSQLPADQGYVLAPTITGHDRDVLVIPTGEPGDRILAALREAGREPVEWQQTPEESARALAAMTEHGAMTGGATP